MGTRASPASEDSWASSPATRHSMQANRSRDTGPELAIRRELHRRGLRYRVMYRAIPGSRRTIDIAFTKRRVAV
ncbi:MAG: very short patch repair endonuclease, partial [Actinomycetia bacterium]|nr:very short patch repair endonuclease [Actinomycetes bacterium]